MTTTMRKLGKTGLEIPPIVFGTSALGNLYQAHSDELKLAIMNFVRKQLSPLAMPHEIEFVKKLPKTRSGKIVRRILRAQAWGQPVGDLSSLDD